MNEQLQTPAKTPIDHIHTIGKVTKIIATICCICIFVGACMTLVSGIVMCCLPQNLMKAEIETSAAIDIDSAGQWWAQLIHVEGMPETTQGGLQIRLIETGLSTEPKTVTVDTLQFGGALICIGISLMLFSGVFRYVSQLGKTLHTVSSPFTAECVKGLKKLAISVLVWSLGSSILSGAMEAILHDASRYLNLEIDSGSVLLALALLAIAYIFQYGVSLQQEADTTL